MVNSIKYLNKGIVDLTPKLAKMISEKTTTNYWNYCSAQNKICTQDNFIKAHNIENCKQIWLVDYS